MNIRSETAGYELTMNLEDQGQSSLFEEDEFLYKPGTKSELWNYFRLKKNSHGKPIDDGSLYSGLHLEIVPRGGGKTCVHKKMGGLGGKIFTTIVH